MIVVNTNPVPHYWGGGVIEFNTILHLKGVI